MAGDIIDQDAIFAASAAEADTPVDDTPAEEAREEDAPVNDDTNDAADPQAAEGDEPAGDADPEPEAEAPKKPNVQKRLEKVLAQQAALKAENEALRLAVQSRTPEEPSNDDEPKLFTRQQLEAEAAKIATQKLEAQRVQNEQIEFNRRCNSTFDEGVKSFGDEFSEAVQNLQASGLISTEDPTFLQTILDTDAPAALLHHLGQDEDEAERLASLSPIKRAVEMGKLAAKLASAPAPVPAKPTPKPISKAPPPITPVGGNTAKEELDPRNPEHAERMTSAEWFAAMEKLDRKAAS